MSARDRIPAPKSSHSKRRIALLLLTAGVITLVAGADAFAQRGGMGMGGVAGRGGGMNVPAGPRFPGGGGGVRFPGGGDRGVFMIPPGFRPGGRPPVVVYDDDDEPRRRIKRVVKKTPKKPSQDQAASTRAGFSPPPPGEQRFVRNEILLNIATGTSPSDLDAIARRHRLTRLEQQDFVMTQRSLARLRINDGRPVAAVIRSLRADTRVLGAQPNYLYALQQNGAAAASDEGQTQYALAKMHLPQAHAITTGASVVVAVIDTMIDAAHPDLQGVIAGTYDATAPDKPHPHGTGIAALVAAHGKLIGAAPAVKLLAIHAFTPKPWGGDSMAVLKGLDWAGQQKANIVNMSFAGPSDGEIHTMLVSLRGAGIVLIGAAGNAGPQSKPLYPAAFPEVIAVTATDADDKLFKMANRGSHIAVAAPGVDVLTAAPDGGYQVASGTSFAAAEVSGIAALILDRNRQLDAAAIRRILMASAHDLGPAGHDDQFGSGLVDALGAVTQAAPATSDVSSSNPAPAPAN